VNTFTQHPFKYLFHLFPKNFEFLTKNYFVDILKLYLILQCFSDIYLRTNSDFKFVEDLLFTDDLSSQDLCFVIFDFFEVFKITRFDV
jgi:hypothetical protein